MKLSVAMATYNGEKYLREQLDSLTAQTRKPDELILCDDRSRDNTVALARDFARTAPFEVTIHENPTQLGYIKNFEKAVGFCTGDVIFLADQDDVWGPGKLARHQQAYTDRPDVGGVFSDAWVVDGDLNPLGKRLWEYLGLGPKRQRKFQTGHGLDLFIKRGFCYGILLSFRSRYRDILIPFPLNFSHDDWITLTLSAFAAMDAVSEPLLQYRQHRGQLIGVGLFREPPAHDGPPAPTSQAEQRQEAIRHALARVDVFEDRVSQFEGRLYRADCRRVIRKRRAYLNRRLSMIHRGLPSRLWIVARELFSGDYIRYGAFPKSDLMADLAGAN